MRPVKLFGVVLSLLAGVSYTLAQPLNINGIADKTVYTDTVTFDVPALAGFTFDIRLNTNFLTAGVTTAVNRADYYELVVKRTDNTNSAVTNRLVRFIVKASERGDTEWGLPPHTPFPVIQSSSNEFSGAHLRLLAPQTFPTGYAIPIVAWVEDDSGHAVRANGLLAASGHPSIQLRRGVGSGFLAATNPAGPLNYATQLPGLQTNTTIMLENSTTWSNVSGVINSNVTWPANSRIFITTNLGVNAGATLTIGAGTIVRVNARTDITNNGSIIIAGTTDQPVVFMPNSPSQPWGGFLMRTGTGTITGTGVIFTGSGAIQNWFGSGGNPGSHRPEQALFFVQQSQSVSLTDSAAIYLAGQLGHAVAGGTFNFTRFLMQRTTTGGEFTGANFTVNDSAFIECPDDSVNFVDGDNDAIYLVSGTHNFTNTLFGWTKDDGVDSGGSGVGVLHYENCWFEATFHEGNSLSGLKNTTARGTVYFDCGQGLEDGYGAGSGGPTGRVDTCVFSYCQVGVRHGDNYQGNGSGYYGDIGSSNSIFLYNHHDVFGYDWITSSWTNAVSQMFITNNFLTIADTNFPNNSVWNPATDASRLIAFGARGRVGMGFGVRAGQISPTNFPDGVPVGLSMFCTNEVAVDYTLDTTDGSHTTGTLRFPAGQTRQFITPLPAFTGVLRIVLSDPQNADLTSATQLLLQNLPTPTNVTLVSVGSSWKYLDDGSDQSNAWRQPDFNDAGWSNGVAELGFGDGDEATVIRRTNSLGTTNITFYFRKAINVPDPSQFASLPMQLRYDDGGMVYLNGSEIFRTTNMPASTITNGTFANATGENNINTTNLPPQVLQSGTNIVAVEIHQQSLSSSDVSFDLQFIGQLPTLPARIELGILGDKSVIYWQDNTFNLEQSDSLTGPWTPVPGGSPVLIDSSAPARFFRLRN